MTERFQREVVTMEREGRVEEERRWRTELY